MDRKKLIKELEDFKKRIEEKYGVNTIILFGSRATGKYQEDSDVDLIIVGQFSGRNSLTRSPLLYDYWDLDLPVDFLCYTPEEFEKLKNKVSIVREALSEGIIIK